jgi:HPt (histidine-containing phosphotransfer) domain-containing protein
MLLARLIQKAGFAVQTATDAHTRAILLDSPATTLDLTPYQAHPVLVVAALDDTTDWLARGARAVVAKPVRSEQLITVLQRHLPQTGAPTVEERRLMLLANLYRAERAKMLGAITTALASAQLPQVATAAHSLAGALCYLPAAGAVTAARHLEAVARHGDLTASRTAWTQLEAELAHMEARLPNDAG